MSWSARFVPWRVPQKTCLAWGDYLAKSTSTCLESEFAFQLLVGKCSCRFCWCWPLTKAEMQQGRTMPQCQSVSMISRLSLVPNISLHETLASWGYSNAAHLWGFDLPWPKLSMLSQKNNISAGGPELRWPNPEIYCTAKFWVSHGQICTQIFHGPRPSSAYCWCQSSWWTRDFSVDEISNDLKQRLHLGSMASNQRKDTETQRDLKPWRVGRWNWHHPLACLHGTWAQGVSRPKSMAHLWI